MCKKCWAKCNGANSRVGSEFMEAELAELAERYECEVEEDATDVDLEEKELTEVPAVVCQLQARSTRPSRSLAL